MPEPPYIVTGTAGPLYIPRGDAPKVVRPGESYFVVKIRAAQVAFSGSLWERVRQLVIVSQVALNHPMLGPDPLPAIQRSREVHPNRAEQLGLSPNLINLVPATMDRVSASIEFVLDRESRLSPLGGLINSDAFLAAVSLAPGGAIAARTIAGLAQKILQTFLTAEQRLPILQFSADFNIATGELQEGYYAILGTRDERSPIPRPLPQLEVQNGELLTGGQPVTQWSYVLLEVRVLEARTRDLNDGARWSAKLRQAEAAAQRVSRDPFAEEDDRQSAWKECKALLKEAQVLLLDDPNYLRREADDILRTAYWDCYASITGESAETRMRAGVERSAAPWIDARAEQAAVGLPADVDVMAARRRYTAQVAEARQVMSEAGMI